MKIQALFALALLCLTTTHSSASDGKGMPKTIQFTDPDDNSSFSVNVDKLDFTKLEISDPHSRCTATSSRVEYVWNGQFRTRIAKERYFLPHDLPDNNVRPVVIDFTTPGCRVPKNTAEASMIWLTLRHQTIQDVEVQLAFWPGTDVAALYGRGLPHTGLKGKILETW